MFQLLLSGGIMGLIYSLIALGFQISYSTSKTSNFGQGAVVMLGGFIAAVLTPQVGYWWALPGGMVICGAAGVIVERLAVAPALSRKTTDWVVATIALGLIFEGAQETIFGRDELAVQSPLSDEPLMLGSVALLPQELLIAVVCVMTVVVLTIFYKGRWGKAFEAVSTDKDAAAMQGIPAHLIVVASYVISSSIAGLAGWAVSPITGAGPTLALLGIKGFCVAVTAGMNSSKGALITGLVFGMTESLTAYLIPSGYRSLPVFLACALVLMFKPTGLFGKARNKKV